MKLSNYLYISFGNNNEYLNNNLTAFYFKRAKKIFSNISN